MDFQTWIAFVAASTALLLIPGPTVLLVLSYAMSHGKRVALATVGGVALGDFIAMTASLAGLGALVLTSATLFIVLKRTGVETAQSDPTKGRRDNDSRRRQSCIGKQKHGYFIPEEKRYQPRNPADLGQNS